MKIIMSIALTCLPFTAHATNDRLKTLTNDLHLQISDNEWLEVCIDELCETIEPAFVFEKKSGKEQKQQPAAVLEKLLDRIPVLSGKGTVKVKYIKKNADGSSEEVEVEVELSGSTGKE